MVISDTLLYDTIRDVTRSEVKQPYSREDQTLTAPRAFAGEAHLHHAGSSPSSNTNGHHRNGLGP